MGKKMLVLLLSSVRSSGIQTLLVALYQGIFFNQLIWQPDRTIAEIHSQLGWDSMIPYTYPYIFLCKLEFSYGASPDSCLIVLIYVLMV